LSVVAAALVIGGYLYFRERHARSLGITSLAVLPLENLTGDPSQEYFSDGMTDALITQLAQLRGLRVISRTSTVHYKGSRKTLPEISRELNVDAIVEGAVSRGGDRMKITAQLIHTQSDTHLWAASFTGSARDALQLQGRVAEDIAYQVRERLTLAERTTVTKSSTADPEAYDEYLKGVFFLNKQTPEDIRTAVRHFRMAIDRDGNFAAAYSRLASCYFFLSSSGEVTSEEAYAPAKEVAEKALALDENLDQAHATLAVIEGAHDWKWTKQEAEFKRAIQLNSNSAFAHLRYSQLLLILGRLDESAEEEHAATILDPLSIDTLSGTVVNSYYRRQYVEGLAEARAALKLYPQVPLLHVFLSDIYVAQGNDKQAAEEILSSEESEGAPPERMAALKRAKEAAGLRGLRQQRIELNKKLAGQQSFNAYDIAIDYAAIGEPEQALFWLEKAFRARDPKITLIGVEPIFDYLHSNARFVALLRQMGLSAASSSPR
jgi:TolB-like protein